MVVALTGIVLLFPFAIIILLLMKSSSSDPFFFLQERIGRYGRPFKCIKFRTMTTGNDHLGTITTADDARITPLGRFLRKFKLDEFPQLWNVLIGKMSLVGPRPDVAGYADLLSGGDRIILQFRPGITGPASIFFRYEEQLLAGITHPKQFNDTVIWPAKIAINRRYCEKYLFFKDFVYIFITLLPVINTLIRMQPDSPQTCDEFEVRIKEWHFG